MLCPVYTMRKIVCGQTYPYSSIKYVWRKYLISQIQNTQETWNVSIIYKQNYFQQNLIFQTFAQHVSLSIKTEGARGISPLRVSDARVSPRVDFQNVENLRSLSLIKHGKNTQTLQQRLSFD